MTVPVDWPLEFRRVKRGPDRKKLYDRYLSSPTWKKQRKGALERAENRCQVCCTDKKLHVHHRSYERIGAERPADLTVLCSGCHALFHDKGPKPKKAQSKRRSKKNRKRRHKPTISTKSQEMLDWLAESVPPGTYTVAEIAERVDRPNSVVGARLDVLRRVKKGRVERLGKSRYVIHEHPGGHLKLAEELDQEFDERIAA